MRCVRLQKPSDFQYIQAPQIVSFGRKSARDKKTRRLQTACARPARAMYSYHCAQEHF